MASKIEFKGKKDHRQVVKNISISEDSYKAIKNMLDTGASMTEDVYGPLIDDTYSIFGGSVYGGFVELSIVSEITSIFERLYKLGMLEESVRDISSIEADIKGNLFPALCYTDDKHCEYNQLSAFNPDIKEVKGFVNSILKPYKTFEDFFDKAIIDSSLPAGEIALGVLMFLSIPEK